MVQEPQLRPAAAQYHIDLGRPRSRNARAKDFCFVRGTRISTIRGDVAVEDLEPRELVRTRAGNYTPIIELKRQSLSEHRLRTVPNLIPVQIRRGALGDGLPKHDLYVTGSQSFDRKHELRLAHLVRNSTPRLPANGSIEYTVFRLKDHSPVRVENIWTVATPAARSFADIRSKPLMKPPDA